MGVPESKDNSAKRNSSHNIPSGMNLNNGSNKQYNNSNQIYKVPTQYNSNPRINDNQLFKAQTQYNSGQNIPTLENNLSSQHFSQIKKVDAELIKVEVPKEQVELYFYIVESNLSPDKNYKIKLDVLTKNSKTLNLGFTNEKTGVNQRIDFDKTYIFDYYFEISQTLKISIVQDDKPKVALETSVGKIMGSKGQHHIIEFMSNGLTGKLCIQGNPVKTTDYKFKFDINVDFGNQVTSPYFIIKRNLSKDNKVNWIKAYRSEILLKYPQHKQFNVISLNTQFLCNSDLENKPILIEFYDYYNQLIGGFCGSIENLVNTKTTYVTDPNGNVIQDKLVTFNCAYKKQYKFLDYVRGGVQVSMMVGIDFTASNGQPTDKISLHSIYKKPNLYEKAIDSCCTIVAYYDSDQLFPVFGYGALIGATNIVNHCFPINLTSDPNIFTVNGILETYRNFIQEVKLYGPTYFGPLINHCNDIAKKNILNDTYYIIIILTDGIINDMQDAIDAVVDASVLPMSIIIIGIGPGGDNGFQEMEELDSDNKVLVSSKNVKAQRDIVQFVEFGRFDNDPKRLSEAVLEEIPSQVISYYDFIEKIPGEPLNFSIFK